MQGKLMKININKKGFTLVEILAVVLIVGVLSAMALPQYRRVVERARATEAIAGLKTLYDSSERLAVDFGYNDYASLYSSGTQNIGIGRLDMFQNSGAETKNDATLSTSNFIYSFPSGNTIAAKRTGGNFAGKCIIFRREDQQVFCSGSSAYCKTIDIEENESVGGC